MVTFVYLVRHGTTDWTDAGRLAGRLPGIPLNARGRRESEALAARTRAIPLRRVAAGPLERAVETAVLIAQAAGLPVERDEAFTERAFPRTWEGLLSSEIRERFPDEARANAAGEAVPGLEAVDAMAERMMSGILRLTPEQTSGAVLIVSHGDPIRALVARIVGAPAGALRAFTIDTASLSRVRRWDGIFAVDYLNSRTHLAAPRPGR